MAPAELRAPMESAWNDMNAPLMTATAPLAPLFNVAESAGAADRAGVAGGSGGRCGSRQDERSGVSRGGGRGKWRRTKHLEADVVEPG